MKPCAIVRAQGITMNQGPCVKSIKSTVNLALVCVLI